MNKSRGGAEKRTSQLPNWLWSNSNALPPVYRRVWEAVREERTHLGGNQGELLVDTKKIFPLLLTSQLPTEVLGYIWGLANQKYAGKLTEQELYVVLALVAVAQTSYPFTNLEVLHLLPGPPEPRLNLTLICPSVSPITQDASGHCDDFSRKNDIPGRCFDKTSAAGSGITIPGLIPNYSHMGETKIDSKPQIVSGSVAKAINDLTPESRVIGLPQTDGKTCLARSSLPTDSGDDFSDFQSAPVPQPTPSVPLRDTKQGSAIGSRLANHNLGVKKTSDKQKKITTGSSGKIHATTRSVSSAAERTANPLAPLGSKETLPSVERLGEIFPKCAVKNQAKTVILKDTAIRNNDPPKSSRESISNPGIDTIRIPLPAKQVSGKFATPVSRKDPENSPKDLMNLQQVEDKYSALRVLVEEPNRPETKPAADTLAATNALSQSDDFGDFVSAGQPEIFSPTSAKTIPSATTFGDDDTNDLFSDFERFRSTNSAKKPTESSHNSEAVSEAFGDFETGASPDGRIFDEKDDGNVESEKVTPKEDTMSVNSIDIGNGAVLTRSSSVPSLDLKLFLSPSADDDQQQVENMHQLIYWEWKQYMESCVLLLQTAASVFGGITCDSVLQEVMSSAQGYNFLCNLAEVAAVCRRVNFSHKEMDINIMGFDDLLMEIDRIWAEMEPFYANIPIVTELPVWPLHQSESSACCALCLTVVTSGRIVYNDNSYHVTCANLWLNCVNHNLPALRYPQSSFHAHSIPIASTGNN